MNMVHGSWFPGMVEEGSGREVWCGVVWCGVVWCGVVWCVQPADDKKGDEEMRR